MFKRIVLAVVAIIVLVPAAGLAYLYIRKPAIAPAPDIHVPMTPERVARGRYIFEVLGECDGCHSQRDFTRFDGPVVASGRGRGNVMSDLVAGLPGRVVAPNITPDRETGIGTWSDGEKIRAIREGVDKDGRALFPMMNYVGYRQMSDEDVQALVAYMNTLSPVRNPLPKTELSFPVGLMIKGVPQPAGSVPPTDRSDRVKYGETLVAIAGCGECHTELKRGQPVESMRFAGGREFDAIPVNAKVFSANITPDLETGIGKWSEDYFKKKFYDYREYVEHGAPQLSSPDQFTLMPWLTFAQLTPEDLGAIYAYLKTVKPVRNSVETHPKPVKTAELHSGLRILARLSR